MDKSHLSMQVEISSVLAEEEFFGVEFFEVSRGLMAAALGYRIVVEKG